MRDSVLFCAQKFDFSHCLLDCNEPDALANSNCNEPDALANSISVYEKNTNTAMPYFCCFIHKMFRCVFRGS